MATNAQIRASNNYNKAHTKQFSFRLNKTTDADIIEHLDGIANKQGYVKSLIRDDIKSSRLKNYYK